MKNRNRYNPAIAATGASWLSNVIVPAKAFRYSLAAVRDERNGFPYTAAMEWRQAACLFAPSTRAAAYFWWQWERIMHLPRRLAGPGWHFLPDRFSVAGCSRVATPQSPGYGSSFICKCSMRSKTQRIFA